jgi:hypothetical protein
VFPGNYFFDREILRMQYLDTSQKNIHTSISPQHDNEVYRQQRNNSLTVEGRKWIGRKIFNEDLIEIQKTDTAFQQEKRNFRLNISPLGEIRGGLDIADSSEEKIYQNTRGFIINGAVNEKIIFQSVFFENQSTLLSYQDEFVQTSKVVPGNGRWKKFKENGYDYAMSSGYILYRVNSNFSVQAGHGKHKIGNGYRSLLLSDNAFNYPYARFESNFLKGKIKYNSIYAVLMNLTGGDVQIPIGTERLFQKKPAAFHHLSINLHRTIQLSFFQSLIWNKSDSMNRNQLNLGFFNPMIFTNTAFYGLQDNKNILTGMEISIRPIRTLLIYGQVVLDESGSKKSISNKTGWQAGIQSYDLFSIQNLFLQIEYNSVRPFTYSATDPGQSYTHYNQALAHPLGANFSEAVGIIAYRFKRLFIQGKINLIRQGLNLGQNYGQDIFFSDFNPALNTQTQLQGIDSHTQIAEGKLGVLLNPKTNLNLYAGLLQRKQEISSGASTRDINFVFLGFSTSIINTYWDF